ncbi:MAG: hypothetical protein WBW71_10865 [Bacteroidota bacterium]
MPMFFQSRNFHEEFQDSGGNERYVVIRLHHSLTFATFHPSGLNGAGNNLSFSYYEKMHHPFVTPYQRAIIAPLTTI